MDIFKQQIEKIDLSLKQAKFAEAKSLFFKLAEQKCPREHLLEICQIARRLNLPYHILRWLHPVVYPETHQEASASDAEKALFAVGLTRVGAFGEAKDILTALPDTQADKVFALGMLYIWQWKYEQAIRPLKKYIHLFPEGHYSYLIGLLNLTAAYVVADDFESGLDSTKILLSHCSDQKLPLVKANTLEILAQISMRQGGLSQAEQYLNESAEILKSSGSDYELFVNKWKLILSIQRKSSESADVDAFRVMAQKKRVFEAVREIDLYQAIASRCEADLFRVYAGTRFSGYKQRIKKLSQFEEDIPRTLMLPFGEGRDLPIINISKIPLTKKSKELLKIVMSDFYRPIQLGEIFRELYPEEKFNPQTSLSRLYQVFTRTQQELKRTHAPIKVTWKNKQISWQPLSAFRLEINPNLVDFTILDMQEKTFTFQQVLDFFGISKSTGYRMIEKAINAKKIARLKPGSFRKL